MRWESFREAVVIPARERRLTGVPRLIGGKIYVGPTALETIPHAGRAVARNASGPDRAPLNL